MQTRALHREVEPESGGRGGKRLAQRRVIGTTHHELVAVNGIARQVHDAFARGATGRDGVKHADERLTGDAGSQKRDEQSLAVDELTGFDHTDGDVDAVTDNAGLDRPLAQPLGRLTRVHRHLDAQNEVAADRDLRDVVDRAGLAVQLIDRREQLRADPRTVRSARGHQIGRRRHGQSVEAPRRPARQSNCSFARAARTAAT